MSSDERRWRAVLRHDPAATDFVFAVSTTGIYCRASCPARRPRRDHVSFFRTAVDAEREGYRACKRCGRPPSGGVLRACEVLARDPSASLDRLARDTGWSPSHLQRVFRRSLGVSPAGYAKRLRFERFGRISGREPSVAQALYAASFGSSRRLYEQSRTQLGMSPAQRRRGGSTVTIDYDHFDGPLGRTLVAATPLGICAVLIAGSDRALVAELRDRFRRATLRRSPALLRFARSRLRKALSPDSALLPLDVRATAFQARVWESLRAIPAGETRTYSEVARAAGRPRSVRAVARACASNPVALLVPCHRVVGSDGSLRGYRWGVERKRKALSLERRIRTSAAPPSGGRGGRVRRSP